MFWLFLMFSSIGFPLGINLVLNHQKRKRDDLERYNLRFAAENAALLIQKAKRNLK